ncbi:MAG: thiamine pyrophosphate-dependent enzyme, partial [Christensenellales bacterium]|nr:thiamine pyrophosphate-dependent enzyme [Christensenellales bacterium]
CNVNQELIGKDSFQEVDITGVTMPITKCNYLVRSVDELADTVREAFAIARSGRPGPVVLDITKNATAEVAEYTPLSRKDHGTSGNLATLMQRSSQNFQAPEPDHRDIDTLVDMIHASEKPLLICGGGVVRSRADKEFEALANKIDSPVAITVMGGGGFRGRNKLTTGMIGMHGSQASNMAVDSCDLLIAIGCRFSDRVALRPSTFARNAKIVQIDIDRSEINKNVKVSHHIIGDAKRVLELLLERVHQMDHSEWKNYVFSYKTETEYDQIEDRLTPGQILSSIARILPQDTIVSTDVGQHQMWAIQHFHFDYPGQLLTSGGFGTMGFGLGAAIGAKAANPDKCVLHITGDGCFRMNCNELATVEHYKLPIITVLFNNGTLGMVRQWQSLIYNGRYSSTTLDRSPDFIKLADAYGLSGRRVTNVAELESALKEALECGHGYVIDCAINIDEMVRPMVGGGSHITQFIVD